MNEQQLRDIVNGLITTINSGNTGYRNLANLISHLNRRLNISDPFYTPLSQAEINSILAVYTPLYTPIKAAIVAASNNLP